MIDMMNGFNLKATWVSERKEFLPASIFCLLPYLHDVGDDGDDEEEDKSWRRRPEWLQRWLNKLKLWIEWVIFVYLRHIVI